MQRTIDKIAAFGAAAMLGASTLEIACAKKIQPETIPQKPNAAEMNIPSSVLAEYHKSGALYYQGGIARCTKGDQIIFEVSLHGQRGPILSPTLVFHEKSYFRENGELMGSISVDNEDVGNEQLKSLIKSGAKLPPDFNEYSCTNLIGFVRVV